MKRCLVIKYALVAFVATGLSSSLAGCGREPEVAQLQGRSESGWRQPPSVARVGWGNGEVLLDGVADPGARVVFAGENGQAYAGTADAGGQFHISLRVPEGGLMLRPRVQVGERFAEGPGLLFLSRGPNPVAAVLFAGEGAFRLDGQTGLDAIDADGKTLIVSGRVGHDKKPSLRVAGVLVPAEPNDDGRWAVVVPFGAGGAQIELDGRVYQYPGMGTQDRVLTREGWALRRNFVGGAVQTTWLPANK